jgi:hypothetical protein
MGGEPDEDSDELMTLKVREDEGRGVSWIYSRVPSRFYRKTGCRRDGETINKTLVAHDLATWLLTTC